MTDTSTVSNTSVSTVSNKDVWVAVISTIMTEVAKLAFGIVIVIVNSYVLYLVLTKTMPEVNKDLVIAIVNGSGMAQGAVLQYYFGSSAGSAAKDRKSQT